jgi:hypothetical protein
VSKATPMVCLLAGACSVTRPVPIVVDAPGVNAYLSEHPNADFRVTEHSGQQYWVHRPLVRGDSLIGRRRNDVPTPSLAVPLDQISELHTAHFSWGRTGAFAGGTLAAALVAIAIFSEEPTYGLNADAAR